MTRINKGKLLAAAGAAVLAFWISLILCWVINIVQLLGLKAELTAEFVIRVLAVPFAPLAMLVPFLF